MKEAKDLTILDKGIYYYNKTLAIAICIGLLYFDLQVFTVILLGGFFLYKIMYFNRKAIFSLGISRFDLLLLLVYGSILLSFFVPQTGIRLSFGGEQLHFSIAAVQRIGDFIIGNIHKLLFWQMVVYSGVSGAVLYVLNVECTRPTILSREFVAIQLQKDVLYNEVPGLLVAINFVFGVVLLLLNWYFLVLFITFNLALNAVKKQSIKALLFGLVTVVCLLSATVVKSNVLLLPNTIFDYLANYGISALLKYQTFKFMDLVHQGVLLFLVPYFLIGFIVSLIRSNVVVNNKIERSNTKQEVIRQAKKQLTNDIELGHDMRNNDPIYISHRELNQHVLVCGTTGAGKTNTLCLLIADYAKDNRPVLMLDGKGAIDLADKLAKIANFYGKSFKLFTLHPELVPEHLKAYVASYNPFATGTFTEWKNKILSLFSQATGKGQQHYALQEETFLNIVMQILAGTGKPVNLRVISNFLSNIDLLKQFALKQGQDHLAEQLEQLDPSEIKDIRNMLNLFTESSYGHLFNPSKVPNVINLNNALDNQEIVLFLFDSSGYKSDTEKLAKLVINDINSTFTQLPAPIETLCVFDEFASYASPNLSDTISLQRSQGMNAVVGTQSVTTVGLLSDDTARIAEELIACCNTFIVQAINHDADAERFSAIFGTRKTHEVTSQIDVASGGGATGMGSSKEVHEYMVHPMDFKNQLKGEGFIIRKVLGLEPAHIKVKAFNPDKLSKE